LLFVAAALLSCGSARENGSVGATTGDGGSMQTHVEVELDIFSGMPNPTWVLTEADSDSFLQQLASVSAISPRELPGNLGYRGFIVRATQGTRTRSIRVQTGTVQISEGSTEAFGSDDGRELERWLLNTGRPHLDSELVRKAELELEADSY
jgi:hypothetical protein